ncbi:MAG: cob(I)yrinic acid a,c-diamide adenosyltransferase [Patescibacteria group bacterium]
MAIYTRTGDKGQTKVFDPRTKDLIKVSKTSRKIKTIGAIDELNSFLGICGNLTEIQRDLFIINAIIAGTKLGFPKSKTKKLERQIDKWEGELPVLKNFIIYSGTPEATHIFYARALCRKAERALVSYSKMKKVKPEILTYLNRLSDFLFMKARKINFNVGRKEEAWKTKKTR